MRRMTCAVLALGLLVGPAARSAGAQEGTVVGVGAGIFDTAAWFDDKGDFDAIEAGVVLRWPTKWPLGIGPMAGVSATTDSAWWLYYGARRPFRLGSCWDAGPTFAFTFYQEGDGKDLGHEIEFRSGLEINCKRPGGSSFGIEFYHLSNASISDLNPGSNSLWFVYAVPLGR